MPGMEHLYRKTCLTENVETMKVPKTTSENSNRPYYTITARDLVGNFRTDYSLVYSEPSLSRLGNQSSIINLASKLFNGSKPVTGKEMEILNKTFSKLRSTVPTAF